MPAIQPSDPAAIAPPSPPVAENVIAAQTESATDVALPAASNVDIKVDGKSPIAAQFIGQRGQERPMPIKLIFQDGSFAGKALDLGTAITNMETSQDAQWNTADNKVIRAGGNFEGIAPRTLSFQIEFADIQANILYLTEQIAHVQQVDAVLKRPPLLILIIGDQTIPGWVSTQFRCSPEEAYSGDHGFRHATIDMEFRLFGGVSSPYASGRPLFPTPIGDELSTEVQADAQRQGVVEVARVLLADCLSEQANDELSPLLAQGQVTTAARVLALSDEAIVQGAIAGLFPVSVLEDPAVAARLEGAIASVMAANEPGVGNDSQTRNFGNALLTGNPGALPPSYRVQLEKRIPQFNDIVDAIQTQALGDDGKIFSTEAGDLLRSGFGACGLSLRRTGTLHRIEAAESESLKTLNDFLANPDVKDAEIKRRFGFDNDGDVLVVRNGQPFQSKQEFIDHFARQSLGGFSSEVAWSNFAVSQPEEAPVDPPLDADGGV